jgi:hypothetical protein
MRDGFHPAAPAVFFARRRAGALLVVLAPRSWLLTLEEPEEIVEVSIAPAAEIEDFAVDEEEPKPEPEPAAEPPPPPPPNVEVEKVTRPVQRSEVRTPDEKPR